MSKFNTVVPFPRDIIKDNADLAKRATNVAQRAVAANEDSVASLRKAVDALQSYKHTQELMVNHIRGLENLLRSSYGYVKAHEHEVAAKALLAKIGEVLELP